MERNVLISDRDKSVLICFCLYAPTRAMAIGRPINEENSRNQLPPFRFPPSPKIPKVQTQGRYLDNLRLYLRSVLRR